MTDNSNIEDYQITPEDLGCLGEPENPAGLVEESGLAEKKVPISKSFEHIPFAVKKRARALYDTFEGDGKDMSFEDFCVEMYALESPALMKQDLAEIIEGKHEGNRRMAANLHDINEHLN